MFLWYNYINRFNLKDDKKRIRILIVMFKIGRPELLKKDHEIRFTQIQSANQRFNVIRSNIGKHLTCNIDQYTKLYIKGLGNDSELISCFRELLFNSRELLHSLLFYISKTTNGKTNHNFLKFAKQLMENSYDKLNLEILNFLKNNITYIFHIRKFRNEIKNKISNIEFFYDTNHVEAVFKVPIINDEKELIPYLDINNKDEAIKNNSYNCKLNLDIYFPEMVKFWETVFTIMEKQNSHLELRKEDIIEFVNNNLEKISKNIMRKFSEMGRGGAVINITKFEKEIKGNCVLPYTLQKEFIKYFSKNTETKKKVNDFIETYSPDKEFLMLIIDFENELWLYQQKIKLKT